MQTTLTTPFYEDIGARLDFYDDPMEMVMSRPGAPDLVIFLKPDQALLLAEKLTQAARRELLRKPAAR